jgi:DNA-binding cell septation regulator SpoVG
MLKKHLSFIFLLAIASRMFVTAAEASDIFVTDVTISHPRTAAPGAMMAAITINDVLEIKDIVVARENDEIFLEFPVYVSKTGRVYPQIEIKNLKTEETIKNAIENGKTVESPGRAKLGYAITRFSAYNGPGSKIKTFANVVFNDSIEVEVKLLAGEDGVWVAWPARKDPKTSKWIDQIVFKDKRLREEIEAALLDRYELAQKTGKSDAK